MVPYLSSWTLLSAITVRNQCCFYLPNDQNHISVYAVCNLNKKNTSMEMKTVVINNTGHGFY